MNEYSKVHEELNMATKKKYKQLRATPIRLMNDWIKLKWINEWIFSGALGAEHGYEEEVQAVARHSQPAWWMNGLN